MGKIVVVDSARYLFLASAIAGKRLSIHTSPGDEALTFSDGQSIVLPGKISCNEVEVWTEVVVQAALIGAGSFDAEILRRLVGRKAVAERYLYLEVLRASQMLSDRLPWSFSARPEVRVAPLTTSASSSLAYAVSGRPLPLSPTFFGTLKPLRVLRRVVSDDGILALSRKKPHGEIKKKDAPESEDDEAGEESTILKLLQNPLGSSNLLSDLLNNLLGAGSTQGKFGKGEGTGGGDEMPIGRVERAIRRGIDVVLARLPFGPPELAVAAGSNALLYPEWDEHKKAYRPDWVLAEEVEPWRPDGVQDLGDVLKPPSRELQRQLASLCLDHQMHRRQIEGADLDVDPLLDCAIELRSGHSPASLNIYRTSRRTRRDLAVAVALDVSGSTGERDGQGGSVFHKQMQVAYQLSATLNTLGDTVAMFGFHSWGRTLVRVVRLKGHRERWGARVAERFSLLEPVGYTRTGSAIRHGTRLLASTIRLPARLLILITDGVVYDQGYEQAYAEADARKALTEARAAETACICLSIGAGTRTERLREIFGEANILAVDEPEQITGRIREVSARAVLSVARRRLGQRRAV